MGSKSKGSIAYEHMSTGIKIDESNACRVCPYKMYAKPSETVSLGIGNIHSNFIFILPAYDAKAKLGYDNILSLLVNAYGEMMGSSIFDAAYITRLVKCNKQTEHNMYYSSIPPCSKFLTYEVNKLGAKHVVFFGATYEDYVNYGDTVSLNVANRTIHKLYSPAILFYDNAGIKKTFFNDLATILSFN